MLCVEDYLDALQWAKSVGGLKALIARADANAKVIARLGRADAVDRLPRRRSGDALQHLGLPEDRRSGGHRRCRPTRNAAFVKDLAALLEKEGVAYDIAHYRDAPPGLRIWCGATVEARRCRGADALARLGLRASQGRAAEGGVDRIPSSPRKRGLDPILEHLRFLRFAGSSPRFADDDRINGSITMAPKFSSPTRSRPPPCRSSRIAASRSISSRSSARTRTSSPRSSATTTASRSARPPR